VTPRPTTITTQKPKNKVNTPLYNKHKRLLKKVRENGSFKNELNRFSKIYNKNNDYSGAH
jgi:hypothetical protein